MGTTNTKAYGTQAGENSTDTATDTPDAASVEAGDLVETHDGQLAIVTGLDPVQLLILGRPEVHELPLRKVF